MNLILLGLVDTPGTPAGSLSEPQIRGGVSKARISFATERIRHWVSDPINSGLARMEVRLGAPRAPELLSEPPRRAKKVALRNLWGKRYGTFPYYWGLRPQHPCGHGSSRDSICGPKPRWRALLRATPRFRAAIDSAPTREHKEVISERA